MKRLFWSFAFLFLIAGATRPACALVSISSSSASVGPRSALLVWPRETLTYTETGNFTGTMNVEKSLDGLNFTTVVSTVNNAGSTFTGKLYNGTERAFYRFNASTITAGSFISVLTQNDDVVNLVPNLRGQTVIQVNDESMILNGNSTVTGNETVSGTSTIATVNASTATFGIFQSTAPRSATVGITPNYQFQFIWNTTDSEVCISTGLTKNTWVEVSTPTAVCKH